jgi:hypothetical protein
MAIKECCTGDCNQGRDCPLRARVAKSHPHKQADKSPAPPVIPIEPGPETPTIWAPWTDWLLMLVAVVFCMTVVAGASFYFYNSLLA